MDSVNLYGLCRDALDFWMVLNWLCVDSVLILRGLYWSCADYVWILYWFCLDTIDSVMVICEYWLCIDSVRILHGCYRSCIDSIDSLYWLCIDSVWILYGFCIKSVWTLCNYVLIPVVIQYGLCADSVGSSDYVWILYGFSMDSQRRMHWFFADSALILCGFCWILLFLYGLYWWCVDSYTKAMKISQRHWKTNRTTHSNWNTWKHTYKQR